MNFFNFLKYSYQLCDTVGRPASFIADALTKKAKGKPSISIKQSELAEMIGHCKKTVNRSIKKLIEFDLISLSGQEGTKRINTYIIHYDKIYALCPDFNKYVTKFGKGV